MFAPNLGLIWPKKKYPLRRPTTKIQPVKKTPIIIVSKILSVFIKSKLFQQRKSGECKNLSHAEPGFLKTWQRDSRLKRFGTAEVSGA